VKNVLRFMKTSISIYLFFIVLMVAFGTFIYQGTANTMQNQMGDRCFSIASAVAIIIEQDVDGYREFCETLDTDSEYYKSTKALLEEIRYTNDENIRFLYTEMRISDNEMMYVLDGEKADAEYFSPPGSTDALTQTRRSAYDNQSAFIGQSFSENDYGRLLSAYVPIRDNDGVLLGFVGVDISSEQYDEVMRYELFIIIGSIAILTLLMIALSGLLIRMYNEKIRSDQESASKSTFLARMSHEIRTPMNAIMGMSELMLRENLTPAVQEQTRNVHQAAINLLAIINDILDFSKIESGKMEFVEAPYRFSSLINDVINIFQIRLTDKPILFVVNIDSHIPDVLLGDEVRFRQILTNVLANAVKYTQEGSISVTINYEEKDQHTAVFSIKVADTGIGIKKEDLDKLFGDFTQLDMQKNWNVEGTGLGLAITRNLCHAMGGNIEVESSYGEGSTFTITLPQHFDNYTSLAEVDRPESKAVLVYETRKVYAESILFSVENLGVHCVLVTTRSMFLKELHNNSYTHVFVSSFLFDSSKQIMQSLSSDITLVLLTAYGDAIRPNATAVVMPIHANSVANILNDMDNNIYYAESEDKNIRFIAPDARVLIVDDIVTNLMIVEGLLAPFQMMIDCAQSGSEAIALVEKNRYDLVLMDHMMPEMDGIETTERIRALREKNEYYKLLPIIALTANAVSGMRDMFLQNGMNDFLSKPIEIVKLYAAMEKWIPKDKQKKYLKSDAVVSKPEIKIEGIDTNLGITMTGGDMDNYLQILDVFYEDSLEKTKQIEDALSSGDIVLFTTYIHALKSASASIGAADISERAKALEQAGNNEDLEFITKNINTFLLKLGEMAKNISVSLPSIQSADKSKIKEDKDLLITQLLRLKEALAVINIEAIDESQARLRAGTWSRKVQKELENIYRFVLLFEYEEATRVIENLIADSQE